MIQFIILHDRNDLLTRHNQNLQVLLFQQSHHIHDFHLPTYFQSHLEFLKAIPPNNPLFGFN